jgi:hypothetical protein
MVEYGNQMAAQKKEDTLYLRNARPNRVVFKYADVRYVLEHRGNRQDTVALPIEAEKDTLISRWLIAQQLEKITKDQFHKLATRSVDLLPNQFLKRSVRDNRAGDIKLVKAEGDGSGTLTAIDQKQVHSGVTQNARPEWGGDLMSTEEELEDGQFDQVVTNTNYPSKHR